MLERQTQFARCYTDDSGERRHSEKFRQKCETLTGLARATGEKPKRGQFRRETPPAQRALRLALAIRGPAALLRGGHLGASFRAEGSLPARGYGLRRGTATTPCGDSTCEQVTRLAKASYLFVEFSNQGMSIHSDKSSAFELISPVNRLQRYVTTGRRRSSGELVFTCMTGVAGLFPVRIRVHKSTGNG